jgi:hypothetical protein
MLGDVSVAIIEMLSFNENVGAILALGVASGVAVGAVGARFIGRRSGDSDGAALRERVEMLELRLMTAQSYRVAEGAVRARPGDVAALARLPFAGVMPAFAPGRLLRALDKPDPQAIAKQLTESLQGNVEAAMKVGDAIADAKNLADAAERRRVAAAAKREGAKLSSAVWQTHGAFIQASTAPDTLKAKLKAFFAQVDKLKKRIVALADEPAIAGLTEVVGDIVELLEIAVAIAEEVKRLTA